jgi:hypothetical protein
MCRNGPEHSEYVSSPVGEGLSGEWGVARDQGTRRQGIARPETFMIQLGVLEWYFRE